MVLTRGQRRSRGEAPVDYGLPARMRRFRKMYRPTDVAHRHRLEDRQPKTQRVVSYVRRT